MTKPVPPEERYTDPELRERLKTEIVAGDKGGRAGQWSARKAQLLAAAYERHGGGYKQPPTAEQRHLIQWTQEEWQTADGSARAREGDETARYLPKAAWGELSPEERAETDEAKRTASREGRRFVANPPEAVAARKAAELDELPVSEGVKRARELSTEEARVALEHERGHRNRKTLVEALTRVAGG